MLITHYILSIQDENENQQLEPLASMTRVNRKSKRYSVQTRRELNDPVLHVGGISETPQPQPPAPLQQNGLVMQDRQMQPAPEQLQQQQPAPLQIHHFYHFLQQPHHGMVHVHNTRMMVMAAADPSMYHHQMYDTPQYDAGVAAGPVAGSAEYQNAAAAVYQPAPTGPTGVASPPPGTQYLQQPVSLLF